MVAGPPGVGKNTLINNALLQLPGLRHLATCTTRAPRPGEAEAGQYRFVSLPQFRQMVADDELLEWQEVHPGRYYGVPRADIELALNAGQHLISDIDVLGATCLQILYPASAVLVFILPPALQELVARMQARGDSEQDIQTRIRRVNMELQYADLADHSILNDDLHAASASLCCILDACMRQQHDHPGRQQRRHYEAQLLVSGGERVLVNDEDGRLPVRSLRPAEVPHDAALRCLQQFPDLGPGCLQNPSGHAGSFLPPAAIEVERNTAQHQVRLTWVYRLDAIPSSAPPGWRWQAHAGLSLPPALAQSLHPDERLASHAP